jgi:hypothetical protein
MELEKYLRGGSGSNLGSNGALHLPELIGRNDEDVERNHSEDERKEKEKGGGRRRGHVL